MAVKTLPKVSLPCLRSTQAPKTEPVATETNLSQGSAWMPRVTPLSALKETLFWTTRRSGTPRATIFALCQFSLNQPRESPWTLSSTTLRPSMPVSSTLRSFSNSIWRPPPARGGRVCCSIFSI